jgi:hypothetical protein
MKLKNLKQLLVEFLSINNCLFDFLQKLGKYTIEEALLKGDRIFDAYENRYSQIIDLAFNWGPDFEKWNDLHFLFYKEYFPKTEFYHKYCIR